MKIGEMLKNEQYELYKNLKSYSSLKNEECLSHNDYRKMMKKDSYRRINGAIRQVSHE